MLYCKQYKSPLTDEDTHCVLYVHFWTKTAFHCIHFGYSSIKHFDLWPVSVTLTFEVQACVLSATYHLIMVNMCAQ